MIYLWIKAFHIVAVISWMAALLYLPRLLVYHADAAPGSEKSETFKVMERRLLKAIANPAMGATWILGLILVYLTGAWSEGWFHGKFLLVFVLSGYHGWLSGQVKNFAADRNKKSARYFRIANEIPTLLMIGIVILVIVKPL
ncbi:membrane protein [Agaricicola taiwanensis]|uniref:Protoporphyrinogen IX oxidase n=1 Tax=Agaricicola taiwanensis TaxID=591372 RepID=A0A8J2VEH6_9RHOB|nr:protoporphyrinogen oxidase HemJ [Agaricicola taiwanensis]GGE28804.1 membrane protein [Agaricicola taiwanensis]